MTFGRLLLLPLTASAGQSPLQTTRFNRAHHMISELKEIETRARAELTAIEDEESLEKWRVAYLGRKGSLTLLLRGLTALPLEERRSAGAAANRLKNELEEALAAQRGTIDDRTLTAITAGRLDVTLPGRPQRVGRLHPVTQTLRDVLAAFVAMGFSVAEGPEVEWDYYNFEALRIPKDHPARDMWDTLYIGLAPRQRIREQSCAPTPRPTRCASWRRRKPPIRVVVPGRCYRYEATDPTHEWMLSQVEVLAVDEGITMADLKGTLFEFAKRLFGQERKVRFRCDYFPFVEPGVEMAIDCFVCGGEGCRTCSGDGLDRDPGRRHGPPRDPGQHGVRRVALHRLRRRNGHRAHLHAALRHRRHPALLRQ